MAKREAPRRAFWLSHLRKWRAQGGTMKAYAQANDLPVDTFYAMKSAHARGLSKSTAPATLLPVQLATPPARESIRVSLPNGVRIEVPGRLERDEWRTLLDALSSAS
jgi:hypothetical protein